MRNLILWLMLPCLLVACGNEEQEKKEIIRPVKFEKVITSGGNRVRTFAGVSKAGVEVNLSFKVSGTVEQVNAKVGEHVKAGHLIARINDTDYQLQYEEAQASLRNAEVQQQAAKSNYERVEALYENQNVSLSEYEKAKSGYESASAQVNSIKKRIDLLRSQLSYCKLYAPTDGIIAKVLVEKNENVQAGRMIVELNSGDDLEVTVGIPENLITGVNEGDKVTVEFQSVAGKKFEGVISEVAYAADARLSTYPVTVKLQTASNDIRPGMTANVVFNFTSAGKAAIIVPVSAVAEDRDGRFVFVVNGEDEIKITERKEVQVGDLTGDGIEILSGVKEGELLVTAGVSRIADGMKVRLLNNQ